MRPHPSQFQWSSCNCNSETIGPSKDKQKISTLECVEIVLMVLRAQSLTIGKFLMTLLDEPEGLSQSANKMLKWFIQSHTKEDNPVDVVRAMYNHPWAQPSRSFKPSHHPLPPNPIPLNAILPEEFQNENPNTYGALQQYFASEVIQCINIEANHLCKLKYL